MKYDPHVWLSPKRAIKMVENIRDSPKQELSRIRKPLFQKNAAGHIKKLGSSG